MDAMERVHERRQRIGEQQAEHERDEHRRRPMQYENDAERGQCHERGTAHVDRHMQQDRLAVLRGLALGQGLG